MVNRSVQIIPRSYSTCRSKGISFLPKEQSCIQTVLISHCFECSEFQVIQPSVTQKKEKKAGIQPCQTISYISHTPRPVLGSQRSKPRQKTPAREQHIAAREERAAGARLATAELGAAVQPEERSACSARSKMIHLG